VGLSYLLRRFAASSAPAGLGDYCGMAAGLPLRQASCSVKIKTKHFESPSQTTQAG